jgi:hypothetical protein
LGVNHVLGKPIKAEKLLALVAQYCDRDLAGRKEA